MKKKNFKEQQSKKKCNLSWKSIEKEIMKVGWRLKKQKGSHRHYTHETKKGKVTIPVRKDLPVGTIFSIRRQAGLMVHA